MNALILKHDAALGEGTRRKGEVLAYLPDGVDVRELSTALINGFLQRVAEEPASSPADSETDGGGEDPHTAQSESATASDDAPTDAAGKRRRKR